MTYFGPKPPIHEAPSDVHSDSWETGWKAGWLQGTLDEAVERTIHGKTLSEIHGVIEAYSDQVHRGVITDEEAVRRVGRIFFSPPTISERIRKALKRAR